MAKKRAMVALSGGVDSAVTAALLQRDGYEVIGITASMWPENKSKPNCHKGCHDHNQTTEDVERICHSLGIPLHVIDVKREFRNHVIDYLQQEYFKGRTPNPCIACNQHIKFGSILEHALDLDADYLATGHYALIKHYLSTYHLLKGVDTNKDQSYMLYTLTQAKLARLLMPLGDYTRKQVRQIAREMSLYVANKRSSQDICFATPNYGSLLGDHPTTVPGEIINKDGKILGKHRGIAFYTIGQRHGLGIANTQPLYVVEIEPRSNRIMVGPRTDLLISSLTATNTNWISGTVPIQPLKVKAKIRYRSPEIASTVTTEPDSAEVLFHKPQIAVAPGQSVLFYQGNEVIGGGTIQVTQTIQQN